MGLWFGLAALVFTATPIAGQLPDRSNRPPDIVSATDIAYPVNTTTTGMVAFLLTLDAGGAVKNSQVLQDVPPLTAAAQNALTNWKFKPRTVRGKAATSLLPVYIVFNPYNPAGTSVVGGALTAPAPVSFGASAAVPPQVQSASYALYPANSLATGTVVLSVHIDKSGRAGEIRPVLGLAPLTAAAKDAMNQWGFLPARSGAQPAGGNICVAFVFQRNLS
jgi:outer membrane biosynthesis protein TonB